MSILFIITLIGVLCLLCFWLGSIVGQLAQIEYQKTRQAQAKAEAYSQNPLPDEQEWRALLKKEQKY